MATGQEVTEAIAQQTKTIQAGKREVRLSVVKDPVVGAPREFVQYEDGTSVEVPRRKMTDYLAAEERFGRPLSEIKAFSATSTYTAYLALHRHPDEDAWPEGEYEDWVETIADYEIVVELPAIVPTGQGEDADPLAPDLSAKGQKQPSTDQER